MTTGLKLPNVSLALDASGFGMMKRTSSVGLITIFNGMTSCNQKNMATLGRLAVICGRKLMVEQNKCSDFINELRLERDKLSYAQLTDTIFNSVEQNEVNQARVQMGIFIGLQIAIRLWEKHEREIL
jgi:hypothetical protein